MAVNPVSSFAATRFLSALGALAILASACGGTPDSAPVTTADTVAAEWPYTFVVDQLDGSTFNAGDYAGQDLVLWFWAPW